MVAYTKKRKTLNEISLSSLLLHESRLLFMFEGRIHNIIDTKHLINFKVSKLSLKEEQPEQWHKCYIYIYLQIHLYYIFIHIYLLVFIYYTIYLLYNT